jgi:hypothetical protein
MLVTAKETVLETRSSVIALQAFPTIDILTAGSHDLI